jgi:glutamate--cysteine ligase
LQHLTDGTLYMPHGTSLRMGRLGYQSDAQASLAVSYNSLEGYAQSLYGALTQPYPAYEKVGIRNPGGDYNQLSTSLLQIENEFYGTIRPKRTIFSGERPLHALRERGVEYVEVRLLDLDPFVPVGITASTMHLLDAFLLHCLISDSPPDSPDEIAAIARNQHRTAARGREPGLMLERAGQEVLLVDWASEVLQACLPFADALDATHRSQAHRQALEQALALMTNPDATPAARVLQAMQSHGNSFTAFVAAQSRQTHQHLLALPWTAAEQAPFEAMTAQSVAGQKAIEAADTMPFEVYRQQYLSPDRLRARTPSERARAEPVGLAAP